jgi:hypothetical protein
MNAGAIMAKTKKPASKPNVDEMTTRALKMRREYAEWLESFSTFNRTTLAGLFDQALAEYAQRRGFKNPPERT